MKQRLVSIALAALVALVMVAPAYATGGHGGGHGGGRGSSGGHHGPHPGFHHFHHRGRVFVGVVPFFAYPYWWDYPAYYYPPTVIQPEPPVYIQQQPGGQPYWYYCPSAGAYYPNAPSCPEPWVPVPATPR